MLFQRINIIFNINLYLCHYFFKMKKLVHIIIFIPFLFASCQGCMNNEKDEVIDTIPMMVMQIQKCSRLYSAECQVRKIITHDDTKKLTGTIMNQEFSIDLPFGERKIAIPIDATIKAYIDFEGFSNMNVKKRGKKVEIILPDPEIILTSSRIDREQVKQHVPILRKDFTDEELTSYEKMGRDSIISDIPNLGIMENARLSAARKLIPLIAQMGFNADDVTITFRKQFTLADIHTLIDKTTIEHGKNK